MTQEQEQRAIAALLKLAGRMGGVEAADSPVRALGDSRDDDEGLQLAIDHGIDLTRLRAYESLARSRGVPLADVLRAVFRRELREVITLPPRPGRSASG